MEDAADAEVDKIVSEALAGVLTSASAAPRGDIRKKEAEGKVSCISLFNHTAFL